MIDRLLLCTDLDRTLLPNGAQPESPEAREHFFQIASRPEVTLAYVSGRDKYLVEEAISDYDLPQPDFIIGDVGSSIYHVDSGNNWQLEKNWQEQIAPDWGNKTHGDLKELLKGLRDLTIQPESKQNNFKLSYYVSLDADHQLLLSKVRQRLDQAEVRASLIWSVDEPNDIGLLDVLPESATKLHAIEALMNQHGFTVDNTIFSGDSGNDIEVLISHIRSVLVNNSQTEVRQLAQELTISNQNEKALYIARGNFMGMNGNYAAGILEGIAYYYPETKNWMGFNQKMVN